MHILLLKKLLLLLPISLFFIIPTLIILISGENIPLDAVIQFQLIDGFHGSDKTNLRLLIYLSTHDDKLSKYVDSKFLYGLLQQSKNDYQVIGYNDY